MEIDLSRTILIVTGAHLHAEALDRPLAYGLQKAIRDEIEGRAEGAGGGGVGGRVLVCSDVWYMNNEQLRSCPTISVGSPGVNALSAFLADKLPSAFVVEGKVMVQAAPDFDGLVACCWGAGESGTGSAVAVFAERFLGGFVGAAVDEWAAEA